MVDACACWPPVLLGYQHFFLFDILEVFKLVVFVVDVQLFLDWAISLSLLILSC